MFHEEGNSFNLFVRAQGNQRFVFFSKCKFKCENSTRYLQEHFIKCGHYNSVGYHKVLHTLQ